MVIEKKYYKVDSKELVDLLIQHINEKEIIAYNIPTACPLVFEFDANMKPVKNYYLIDEAELKAK
jgi:2,3-bisphosphoglycerate-dependent phosphoglycerate mutase